MRYASWLGIAVRRPGEQLWAIGSLAGVGWRAGIRPVLAVSAGALCVLGDVAYSTPALRHVAITVGAVTTGLPITTELARLPGSAFLPTAELPLPAAVIQVVVVLGLAELLQGRWATVAVAMTGQVTSTLLARLLIMLGTASFLGLPATQGGALDTGPSAMTAAVGTWLLMRYRAYWCMGMLGAGLVAAASLQDNLDGREHLAAFACGLLAALGPSAARRVLGLSRGAVRAIATARVTTTTARNGSTSAPRR